MIDELDQGKVHDLRILGVESGVLAQFDGSAVMVAHDLKKQWIRVRQIAVSS
jgi:hypothetical protein